MDPAFCSTHEDHTEMNRRHFCKIANLAVLGGLMGLSKSASALVCATPEDSRYLSLYSIQTGEKVEQAFWSGGKFLTAGLNKINHLLRDFRTNEVKAIDPGLLQMLFDLARNLGVAPEYHVISGYRSAATNAMLRKKSNGVARKSFHLQGKAVDIRMPAVALKDLHTAALDLKQGGVGYYPGPDFIHVDVGPTRTW
jgi:uncharacterized protein YcbK (DUF882 family)